MFLDLFRLYKKNGYSDRSPLEDFNTEVFAGILKLNPSILGDFIQLIGLPEDDYEMKTQVMDIPVMLTPRSGHTDPLRILVKKIR